MPPPDAPPFLPRPPHFARQARSMVRNMSEHAFFACLTDPARRYPLDQPIYRCPATNDLLDLTYHWDRLPVPPDLRWFDRRHASRRHPLDFSGVWRFRELMPFVREEHIVTIGEGQTILQRNDRIARCIGLRPGDLHLQYEGLNPTGSFKDNGMTAGVSFARALGRQRVACASTGNTSASMACFAAAAGMQAIVFIGEGKIALGKLSQALDYGALTLQVAGDFDACLARVQQAAQRLSLYLLNSLNAARLEGQKAIMYRVLEALDWEVPDWIVVPGGNLGNSASFGKAFLELRQLGLVRRVPRLAIINAAGADTLHRLYNQRGVRWHDGQIHPAEQLHAEYHAMEQPTPYKARTVASAIEIGRPVNLPKALRALAVMNGSSDTSTGSEGVVASVDDDCILRHRALIARWGFGCEPASAASLAGVQQLVSGGVIMPGERVVCILTGHELKDPTATVNFHYGLPPASPEGAAASQSLPRSLLERLANRPVKVVNDLDAICAALGAT